MFWTQFKRKKMFLKKNGTSLLLYSGPAWFLYRAILRSHFYSSQCCSQIWLVLLLCNLCYPSWFIWSLACYFMMLHKSIFELSTCVYMPMNFYAPEWNSEAFSFWPLCLSLCVCLWKKKFWILLLHKAFVFHKKHLVLFTNVGHRIITKILVRWSNI